MMGVYVTQMEKKIFPGGSAVPYDLETPDVIDTRFGRIELQQDKAFSFSRGLLGMAQKRDFFITEFPSEKLSRFKLLQSLDDYTLSFITLPLSFENEIIGAEDLFAACNELEMNIEHLAVLLIVSVHRSPSKVSLSVNARAPLLIDSKMRMAAQYVFLNDKYQVQHFIG